MKLVDTADFRSHGAAVEVTRLAAEVRLDPGDGPWEVLICSWGLISIRMSAIKQGQDEEPVVMALMDCEAASPHAEHLQRVGFVPFQG